MRKIKDFEQMVNSLLSVIESLQKCVDNLSDRVIALEKNKTIKYL